MASFWPCLKSLPEAMVNSFGLILLEEDMSNQLSLDSVMWRFVFILTKIYNEKEEAEQCKL